MNRPMVMPHSRAARALVAHTVSSSCRPVPAENAETAPLCLCVLVVTTPSAGTSQPPRHQDTKRPRLLHPRLRPYDPCRNYLVDSLWASYNSTVANRKLTRCQEKSVTVCHNRPNRESVLKKAEDLTRSPNTTSRMRARSSVRIEHRTPDPGVVGSNPPGRAILFP